MPNHDPKLCRISVNLVHWMTLQWSFVWNSLNNALNIVGHYVQSWICWLQFSNIPSDWVVKWLGAEHMTSHYLQKLCYNVSINSSIHAAYMYICVVDGIIIGLDNGLSTAQTRSHYLNQWWLLINHRKYRWKMYRNLSILTDKVVLIVCSFAAILSGVFTVISWHGSVFCSTGPLWG